jgi:hypothetical protein
VSRSFWGRAPVAYRGEQYSSVVGAALAYFSALIKSGEPIDLNPGSDRTLAR